MILKNTDVKKPLDVLYPMLQQCVQQEKEIQDSVDTGELTFFDVVEDLVEQQIPFLPVLIHKKLR